MSHAVGAQTRLAVDRVKVQLKWIINSSSSNTMIPIGLGLDNICIVANKSVPTIQVIILNKSILFTILTFFFNTSYLWKEISAKPFAVCLVNSF